MTVVAYLCPTPPQFFVDDDADHFPLYARAVALATHYEPMVRTAARAAILNV